MRLKSASPGPKASATTSSDARGPQGPGKVLVCLVQVSPIRACLLNHGVGWLMIRVGEREVWDMWSPGCSGALRYIRYDVATFSEGSHDSRWHISLHHLDPAEPDRPKPRRALRLTFGPSHAAIQSQSHAHVEVRTLNLLIRGSLQTSSTPRSGSYADGAIDGNKGHSFGHTLGSDWGQLRPSPYESVALSPNYTTPAMSSDRAQWPGSLTAVLGPSAAPRGHHF